MNLSTNAAKLVAKMKRRQGAVKRELGVAARQLAIVAVASNKKIIQTEIYSIPIPLSAAADKRLSPGHRLRKATTKGHTQKIKGKKVRTSQWTRENTIKQGESATADGTDVVMRNNAAHAKARYALGAANPPNKAGRMSGSQRAQSGVPDAQKSKTRSVQWHEKTIVNERTRIVSVRRHAVLRALSSS